MKKIIIGTIIFTSACMYPAVDTVKQVAALTKVDWNQLAQQLKQYVNDVEAAQVISIMRKVPEIAGELNKVGSLGPLNDARDLILKIAQTIGEVADLLDNLDKTSKHVRTALQEHGAQVTARANCLLKDAKKRTAQVPGNGCIEKEFCVKRGACLKKAIGDLKALLQVLIGETMISEEGANGKKEKPLLAQMIKMYSTIPGTPTQASMLNDLRPVSDVLEIIMSILDVLENIIQE